MTSREVPARVAQHAAAFNAAVQSGDWRYFADRIGVRAFVKYSNRLIARIDRPSGTNGLALVLARARVGPSGRLMTIPKA